ncbi:MAG: phosphate acyltransferase, partial [Gammaproteobacteria bacterium]|nr:phosphate acyltransferase [Gammaproteobacteria bacterium]
MTLSIALDAMGGDHGAPVVVPAALEIIGSIPDVRLILVGDQHKLTEELNKHGAKVGG